MGVMKRIQGWRDSRWPIPDTLQALAGLIEPRDPEAYLEARRAAREPARERAAIQAGPTLESMRTEVAREHAQHVEAFRSAVRAAIRGTPAGTPAQPDVELPVRTQPGWYRYDRTFYRVGQGPFADWGRPDPKRGPATNQLLLF